MIIFHSFTSWYLKKVLKTSHKNTIGGESVSFLPWFHYYQQNNHSCFVESYFSFTARRSFALWFFFIEVTIKRDSWHFLYSQFRVSVDFDDHCFLSIYEVLLLSGSRFSWYFISDPCHKANSWSFFLSLLSPSSLLSISVITVFD